MPLQEKDESRRISPPQEAMDKSLKVGEDELSGGRGRGKEREGNKILRERRRRIRSEL